MGGKSAPLATVVSPSTKTAPYNASTAGKPADSGSSSFNSSNYDYYRNLYLEEVDKAKKNSAKVADLESQLEQANAEKEKIKVALHILGTEKRIFDLGGFTFDVEKIFAISKVKKEKDGSAYYFEVYGTSSASMKVESDKKQDAESMRKSLSDYITSYHQTVRKNQLYYDDVMSQIEMIDSDSLGRGAY